MLNGRAHAEWRGPTLNMMEALTIKEGVSYFGEVPFGGHATISRGRATIFKEGRSHLRGRYYTKEWALYLEASPQ